MKYLIVGLGNPGAKYENTRHNIGFKVLDHLIGDSETTFETEKLGEVAKFKFKGRTLILLKPSTFMNLSGKAVNYWMQKEKITLQKLLIVVDDIAIPFGKLRLKGKGSDAGHNGLKDINLVLNTSNYSRLKFGVGNDFHPGQLVEYVLGEWPKNEKEMLPERMDAAVAIIKAFTTIGLNKTMSEFNNK
ncbi:aminoacyl-tRNA hydrolase [Putridiphycobacter roseus]|uniref:Peptidyl-tRNA hydrolase n=1 Tax=Putridiphycobacter roseus TaxID=2219161 RepID=A0A2W1MY31_9FLAO|nr:aminoacyl-tRNA hydrolase [Putridiphycobacter roseus]PZE16284.1 aminoacyl-tRNA hydrolase [Putridiphycobacter roseus]